MSFAGCMIARRAMLHFTAGFLSALIAAGPATAQDAKAVVPESVPAAPAFGQWVNTIVFAVPEPTPSAVNAVQLAAPTAVPAQGGYQPAPVILGLPELPLIGAGATGAARQWSAGFNYQGLHARLLVLDATGRRLETRPLGAPLHRGERFKIRLTTTFPAVAEIGLVAGEAWDLQRLGQIYPTPGMSVQMNAGETVDLPLGGQEYFGLGSAIDHMVLSVRHAGAVGAARSYQPAYRQDGRQGSSYLQLTPQGTLPAFEQLLVVAR